MVANLQSTMQKYLYTYQTSSRWKLSNRVFTGNISPLSKWPWKWPAWSPVRHHNVIFSWFSTNNNPKGCFLNHCKEYYRSSFFFLWSSVVSSALDENSSIQHVEVVWGHWARFKTVLEYVSRLHETSSCRSDVPRRWKRADNDMACTRVTSSLNILQEY